MTHKTCDFNMDDTVQNFFVPQDLSFMCMMTFHSHVKSVLFVLFSFMRRQWLSKLPAQGTIVNICQNRKLQGPKPCSCVKMLLPITVKFRNPGPLWYNALVLWWRNDLSCKHLVEAQKRSKDNWRDHTPGSCFPYLG